MPASGGRATQELQVFRAGWVSLGVMVCVALLGAGASLAAGTWGALYRTSDDAFEFNVLSTHPRSAVPTQEAVSVAAQLDAAGQGTLLVSTPSAFDGDAVVQAVVDGSSLTDPAVGHLPAGWTSTVRGQDLVLSGPPIAGPTLSVRIDVGVPVSAANLQLQLSGAQGSVYNRVTDIAQLPQLTVGDALDRVLHFPWQVAPGEAVTFQAAANSPISAQGSWTIGGVAAQVVSAVPGQAIQYQWQVPSTLAPGTPVSFVGTNAFGQTVVNVPNPAVVVASPPASAAQVGPSLSDCTPRGFAGRVVCLCGWFPTTAARDGFTLEGQALGVVAASSTTVLVRIPDNAQPGPRVIKGDPALGFAPDESIPFVVLAARGSVDQNRLRRGQTTPLRLEVLGTTEQLDIVLTNYTPNIVNITGGIVQIVRSSGGTPNIAQRQVQGITPGAFDIGYQTADDPCPCVTGPGTVVAGTPTPTPSPPGGLPPVPPVQGGGTTTGPPPVSGDSTRTPPLPPVPGGERTPPPVPPANPPAFPPPDDEDDADTCCGFRPDGTLTFPKITDPMVPADVAVAPRDPAVGAFQVLLHSGAYFHNELDLEIDAVGFPFRFARHYKGDIETVEGGVLGHKWDFSLNKRIVPQAVRELGNNMLLERPVVETPQLWYFDGQGRGMLYDGIESEWRDIVNFGVSAPFRAFVTTFQQQPGDFYEIQRYVLEDPSRHPFGNHPDVDTERGEAIFYVLRERNGLRYVFNCRGQLLHTLHRNDMMSLAGAGTRQQSDSVRMTFEYDGALNPLTQNYMLSLIRDPSGHLFTVKSGEIGQASLDTNLEGRVRSELIPIPRLSEVQGVGRAITFNYNTSATGGPTLESVTDSVFQARGSVPRSNRTTRYGYDAENRLTTVTTPKQTASEGKPYLRNRYGASGKVVEQTVGHPDSANTVPTYLAYSANRATVRDGDGNETLYELEVISGYPVVRAETVTPNDPTEGGPWTTTLAHNGHTQITRMTEPRGNITEMAYDGKDDPVTEGTIRNKSSSVTYAHDLSAGNIISVTRRPGSAGVGPTITSSMSYEPLFNQIAAEVDARGSRTTYRYAYSQLGDLGNYLGKQVADITRPDNSKRSIPEFEREYNVKGQPTREHLDGHQEKLFSYDARGYLIREQFPGGSEKTYQRDLTGLVLEEGGTFGTTRFQRGAFGEVIESTIDPGGLANRTRFRYDLDGGLIERSVELKDNFAAGGPAAVPGGWVTERYVLDILGRVVRQERTGGSDSLVETHRYNSRGLLESSTRPGPDPVPVEDRHEYDARGLLIRTHQAVGTAYELRDDYTYDANGNQVRHESTPVRDPAGLAAGPARITVFEYDGLDRETATIDPLGARTTYTLDAAGNRIVEAVTEGNGGLELRRGERTFDELGNLVAETAHALNGGGHVSRSEIFLNASLARERSVGPAGGVATYQYDAAGRVTQVVAPSGDTTRSTYDAAGNRTTQLVVEVGQRPDSFGLGRPVSTRRLITYEYDALGRVTRESTSGLTTQFFYDSFNNNRGVIVNGNQSDSVRYDGLGRKVARRAGRATLTLRYGPNGLPAERSDGVNTTVWTWDPHGQLVTETRNGSETRYRRDALGNPLQVHDANGTVVTSTFNEVGLPLSQSIQPATEGVPVNGISQPWFVGPRRVDFEYDVLGQTTFAGVSLDPNPGSTGYAVANRLAYDGLGRVEIEDQEIFDSRYTLRRAYSADHQSTTTTYPTQAGGLEVTRKTDVIGRVTEISTDEPGLGVVASYLYDGPNRMSARSYANGVQTRYRLDGDLRLEKIEVRGALTSPIWTGTVQYGRHGLESVESTFYDRPAGSQTWSHTGFSYDRLGFQTGASTTRSVTDPTGGFLSRTTSQTQNDIQAGRAVRTVESLRDELNSSVSFIRSDGYRFDANGRRSSINTSVVSNLGVQPGLLPSLAAYDSVARAASNALVASKSFLYDRNGNLVTDGELVYSYDHLGRLTRVMEAKPGGEAVLFSYDAMGRRVRMDPTPPRGTVGLVSWGSWNREPVNYVYEGQSVIAEIDIGGSARASSPVKRRYILGARPGERVRADYWNGTGAVESFFPQEGLQGEIAFVTDTLRRPRTLVATGSAPSPGVTVPDDLRFVEGSQSRAPYLSWTARMDGFAGTRFDEVGGGAQIDYRPIRALGDSAAMQMMRQSVNAAQTRGALTLGAATTAVLTAGSGVALWTAGWSEFTWSSFLTPVLLSATGSGVGGAGMAWYSGDDSYGVREYLSDVGEGAFYGLIAGRVAAAGYGMAQGLVLEGVLQTAAGTGLNLAHGVSFMNAYGAALQESALDASLGLGLLGLGRGIGAALGTRLQQTAARGADARVQSMPRGESVPTQAGSGFSKEAPTPAGGFLWGVTRFDVHGTPSSFSQYRNVSSGAREWEEILLHLMETGTRMSKIAAESIRSGRVRVVMTDMNTRAYGVTFEHIGNTVLINTAYLRNTRPFRPQGMAATLVHEVTHALGGGEISAHVAHLQFTAHLLNKSWGRQAVHTLRTIPWVDDPKLVLAYMGGRGDGNFSQIVSDIIPRYAEQARMAIYGRAQPDELIQNAGGFFKILGIDAAWASSALKQLDGWGWAAGHP